MRPLLAIALLVAGTVIAQAQTIDAIDIVEAGVIKLNDPKTIRDSSISTGIRTQSDGTITRSTTTIEAAADVVFGVKVRLRGRPNGGLATYRVVWKYPPPGLRNPGTGTTKLSDEFSDRQQLGAIKCCYYWTLGAEWTLVPGQWAIEFWDGNRLLASQAFTLVTASRSMPPDPSSKDPGLSQTDESPQ